MASTKSDLTPLCNLLSRHTDYSDIDRLAVAIEERVASALPPRGTDQPLLLLAAWVLKRLGGNPFPASLDAADAEILRLAATAPLESIAEAEAKLVEIGIELALLRSDKLNRLRFWHPLIQFLSGKTVRRKKTDISSAPLDAVPVRSDTDSGEILWSAVKGAAGKIPLAIWEEKLQQARKDIGRFNIIVAGRTGVGKTTLIGAVFGRDVGNTMMGRPRTRGRIWYPENPDEADILRLCDTEGLEMDRYRETIEGLKREVATRNGSHDPFDHIHVARGYVSMNPR
jgi:hypothetical protein